MERFSNPWCTPSLPALPGLRTSVGTEVRFIGVKLRNVHGRRRGWEEVNGEGEKGAEGGGFGRGSEAGENCCQ